MTLQVIEFIKQQGFNALTEHFAVSVKDFETPQGDILTVINYNQIDTPKNPITNECRSLILDKNTLEVVSQSFDRFFNYGEQPETQKNLDITKAVAYDKIDGSIIKIYNYKGTWYVSTRGTAFGDSKVGGFDLTFKELVLKSQFGAGCSLEYMERVFQDYCEVDLDPEFTYICEITAMENRVVTRYSGYKLWLLAVRSNKTSQYQPLLKNTLFLDFNYPNEYKFESISDCIKASKELTDLKEGYVLYQDGVPVCKVKNPAYLAVHHIRGEGLSPKRIADLVIMNEQDEYLTYFPEDLCHFEPYISAFNMFKTTLENVWEENKAIEDQKEFALKVKDVVGSSAMFIARKKQVTIQQAFNEQSDNYKRETLFKYMETMKS